MAMPALKIWKGGLLFPLLAFAFLSPYASGLTRHHHFHIRVKNVTRLCHTKALLTVNGHYPGPAIVAREGDRVVVKLTNHVKSNVTIHWHGIRQMRSAWADGPAYVTQCPIQTGQSYIYNFTITGQRGTLWWHAHISWLRASLYGAIIIHPKKHVAYPFPRPHQEVPILLGEWWNADTENVINEAMQNGGGPNVSDAYTINGLPGPFYNCSAKDTFKLKVIPGKTYLLRIINAALNDELFFAIANHTISVVEADAQYVKPFQTKAIFISPGQTTNVLLTAKSSPPPLNARFLMAARPYVTGSGTFDNSTTAGILEYAQVSNSSAPGRRLIFKPTLPALNDTSFATNFSNKLRSLGTPRFPVAVPQSVDKHFLFTVGLGLNPCPKGQKCQGPNGTKFTASINNISFVLPSTALLQAHYFGKSKGVYKLNFPDNPPFLFNYTGTPPNNTQTLNDTRLKVVPFNATIQVVLQDTSIVGPESHPLHLHGYDFFVVGQGTGNYNSRANPKKFNLVDPPQRNTIGVPSGGWVALRFRADNPGVWFMHCHLEAHTSWGLRMAWVVLDGNAPNQSLPPPPSDLPAC